MNENRYVDEYSRSSWVNTWQHFKWYKYVAINNEILCMDDNTHKHQPLHFKEYGSNWIFTKNHLAKEKSLHHPKDMRRNQYEYMKKVDVRIGDQGKNSSFILEIKVQKWFFKKIQIDAKSWIK